MSGYTHRERFLACINHEEADRIPIDFMGHATMMLDDTYIRMRDHLNLDPIPPIRFGSTANYYDERILEHFDIDFRRVFLGRKEATVDAHHEDGSWTDYWGIRYDKLGPYVQAAEAPFKGIPTIKEVENHPWPKAEDIFHTEGLAEEARRLHQETDYVVVARNPLTYGFLDRACTVMDMQEFLSAMALEPQVTEAIFAHLLEFFKDVFTLFLDAVGPYVDMVEIGDDMGAQQNLLISPTMYRQLIKPVEIELYSLMKEKAPNAVIFRHTDGAIFDIIPELVEVGVSVLNPTQTSSAGMDGNRIKEAYGNIVTFHGAIEGIDNEDITIDDIVEQIKLRIKQLAPSGGYILGSCNHMIDVQPELIQAFFDAAHEYGRYTKQ